MTKKAIVQEQEKGIEIPVIEIEEFYIKLVGDSPLIVHAWNEKAKKMILDKQMKKAIKGREAKDPFIDFCDSLYWLSERPDNPTMEDVQKAKFGFPAIAFKAAAVDGGYQQGVLPVKTTARGAFHIDDEFVEIQGTPEMREDMVRVGMGAADIRYRGEFKKWSVLLHIRYNKNAMSMEQTINLFNIAGFSNGVGEWRPSKGGSYGTFHVARDGE